MRVCWVSGMRRVCQWRVYRPAAGWTKVFVPWLWYVAWRSAHQVRKSGSRRDSSPISADRRGSSWPSAAVRTYATQIRAMPDQST